MSKIRILAVVRYLEHIEVMEHFLREAGFEIDVTEERARLLPQSIGEYDILLDYMQFGGLTEAQTQSVIEFVKGGKGLIGIHSAALPKSPEYTELLGGVFTSYTPVVKVKVRVIDADHPISEGMGDFTIVDELYHVEYDSSLRVLMNGEAEGMVQPACWVKEFGKGRVAYISLGHGREAFENENFQRLVVKTVNWATRRV